MEHTPRKTLQMRYLELKYGQSIEQLLRSLYVDRQMTDEQIAAHLGISRLTLVRWNKILGRQNKISREVVFASEAEPGVA